MYRVRVGGPYRVNIYFKYSFEKEKYDVDLRRGDGVGGNVKKTF